MSEPTTELSRQALREHRQGSRWVETSGYVTFKPSALEFREDTPFDVWSAVLSHLKKAEKSIQWWIGDAIRFGERRYGEMYAQVLEETDYAYGSVANMAYVAGRIESSRRHENLTFSHHQIVASLEPEEQDEHLQAAEPLSPQGKPYLSVGKLRERVYGAPSAANVETIEMVACPHCHKEFALSETDQWVQPTDKKEE